MKYTVFLAFLCFGAISLSAQPKIPDMGNAAWAKLPEDTVIAKFDDYSLTVGTLKVFASFVDPGSQTGIAMDATKFIEQFALMRKLTKLGEAEKLDQQTPTREQIEYLRMQTLATAEVTSLVNAPVVEAPEIQAYYNAHKGEFSQVRVKNILVAFGDKPSTQPGGRKILTEDEAKAKAAKLLAQIKAGADFVKLVHESSDDEASKAKDGDLATVSPTDPIPDAMRVAVFKLKEGEVSDPVRQSNGYYLLKADKITYSPLAKIQDQIFSKLKEQKGMASMESIRQNLGIVYPNPALQPKLPPKPAPAAGSGK